MARRILAALLVGAVSALAFLLCTALVVWAMFRSTHHLGEFQFARLSGSMVSSARFQDVVWRDGDGRVIARARQVTARVSMLALLRGRVRASLVVTAPVVYAPERLLEKGTALWLRSGQPGITIERLRIADGELAGPVHLDQVSVDLSAAFSRDRGSLTLANLSGRLAAGGRPARALRLQAALDWDGARGTATVRAFRGQLGTSACALAGWVSPQAVRLDLERLDLEPADLPALDTPIHLRGSAKGPPAAVAVALFGQSGGGSLRVSGRVDVPARSAALELFLRDFPGGSGLFLSGQLTLSSTLLGHAGSLRVLGDLSYSRAVIDPNLQGGRDQQRFARRWPGGRARISVQGRTLAGGRLVGGYQLDIADPGMGARIAARAPLPAPPRANLRVTGTFEQGLHGRRRLTARASQR
jgi:hypothetical protein